MEEGELSEEQAIDYIYHKDGTISSVKKDGTTRPASYAEVMHSKVNLVFEITIGLWLSFTNAQCEFVLYTNCMVDMDNFRLPRCATTIRFDNCVVLGSKQRYLTKQLIIGPGTIFSDARTLAKCFPVCKSVLCTDEWIECLPSHMEEICLFDGKSVSVGKAMHLCMLYPNLRMVPIQMESQEEVLPLIRLCLRTKLDQRCMALLNGDAAAVKEVRQRCIAHVLLGGPQKKRIKIVAKQDDD